MPSRHFTAYYVFGKAAEVKEVVDKLKQFTDVVGDGGTLGVQLPQVLLINLADA